MDDMEENTQEPKLPKILVVDDKPENLLAMGKLLKPVGAEIFKALSGEEALGLVLRHEFALILLDVQMPVMDGFETARFLRDNKSTETIPIIFVTAISKEDRHVTEGYESGAVDYLYKPVNKDILLSKVRVFLQLDKQRRELEDLATELRALSEQNHLLLDCAAEGILGIDPEGNITFANPAACQLLQQDEQVLLGTSITPFFVEPGIESIIQQWTAGDDDPESIFSKTSALQQGENGSLPVEFSASPTQTENGVVMGGVLVFQDITERKKLEEHLLKMAKYDSLTGLANRTLFMEFLTASITRSEISQHITAVFYLDLDHFKPINDSLGHDVGDELLKSVAERLQQSVRRGDLVARLGGDEFAIVLDDVARPDDVKLVAEKVVEAVCRPHHLGGRELHVSTSVGIAVWPECGKEPDELVKAADTAMYVTKKNGRRGYQYFTDAMREENRRKAFMEQALTTDLQRGNFELFYQPMVALESGRVIGFETEVRWDYDGRLRLQDEFLPLVEELRQMTPFGEWMLNNACREIAQWRHADPGRKETLLAMNLSLSQCKDVNIQAMIETLLEQQNIDPQVMEIEISERFLNEIPSKVVNELKALRKVGVHVALDNFGSGTSALNYLRRLTVDVVKIDPGFIHEIGRDSATEGIIRAMTFLAKDMGIKTVAEGIDSEAQLAFVRDLGYDRGQGLLLGAANPVTRLEDTVVLPDKNSSG
ncbi:two-component system response regulator [Kistimonas asteriae]|uniref:two-component system response regulator n=1 Tax=Kistimonas asteriae TaxID=517724 RepID=UPI001BA6DAD8|nr:EAL domain-containing protein [Kistimonas asteriae]